MFALELPNALLATVSCESSRTGTLAYIKFGMLRTKERIYTEKLCALININYVR